MTDYIGGGLTAAPKLQADTDLLARLIPRITKRDRWLLAMLHEHRVLTLPQLTQLAFPSERAARHRMLMLTRHRAVDRFRPARAVGSAPHHYLLGPVGAALLSQQRETRISYRADHVLALAHSAKLAHLVGANSFFTALAAAPSGRLETWWSEQRCRQAWGATVRPDGYGQWRAGGRVVDFFLEYDTGTEPLTKVAAKLDRYAELADASDIRNTLVLFALPNSTRQRHLHALIGPSQPVPVATTTGNPAAPTWWLAGGSEERRALADLAANQ